MSRAFVAGLGLGALIQPLTAAGAWALWQIHVRRAAR